MARTTNPAFVFSLVPIEISAPTTKCGGRLRIIMIWMTHSHNGMLVFLPKLLCRMGNWSNRWSILLLMLFFLSIWLHLSISIPIVVNLSICVVPTWLNIFGSPRVQCAPPSFWSSYVWGLSIHYGYLDGLGLRQPKGEDPNMCFFRCLILQGQWRWALETCLFSLCYRMFWSADGLIWLCYLFSTK